MSNKDLDFYKDEPKGGSTIELRNGIFNDNIVMFKEIMAHIMVLESILMERYDISKVKIEKATEQNRQFIEKQLRENNE